MQAIKAESGQGWARGAVTIGAALSVSGNITHTALTESAVHLAIRIVQSAFLPVILFVAVEVFVRVAWRRGWLDFIGRAMLILLPGFGAGYVSFFHLRDLAVLSGEDKVGSIAGPLAIDGLMIGGAVALLAIRAARLMEDLPAEPIVPLSEIASAATEVHEAIASLPRAEPTEPTPAEAARLVADFAAAQGQPLDMWQRDVAEKAFAAPRRPRATSEELEKAVRMLIERQQIADVVTATGLSLATVRLYAKAIQILRNNPQAEIGPKLQGRAIKADMIAIIRDAMNRERPL